MRRLVVLLVALVVCVGTTTSAIAAGNVLTVTPGTVNFGTKPVGSVTLKSTTITNTSDESILLTLSLVRSWDDFSGGWITSTCLSPDGPTLLAAGESCTLVEGFSPSDTFLGIKQDQIWVATATDPATGAVLETQEIVFFGRAR